MKQEHFTKKQKKASRKIMKGRNSWIHSTEQNMSRRTSRRRATAISMRRSGGRGE